MLEEKKMKVVLQMMSVENVNEQRRFSQSRVLVEENKRVDLQGIAQ